MFLDYIKLFFAKKSIKKALKNTIHSVSKDKIKSVAIFPDVKHSDHCPAFLELKLK